MSATNNGSMPGRTRQLSYRGFEITVGASLRLGGVLVSARLNGGPDNIARQFALPSAENDLDAACDAALADLCALVDRLLSASRTLPGSSGDDPAGR